MIVFDLIAMLYVLKKMKNDCCDFFDCNSHFFLITLIKENNHD